MTEADRVEHAVDSLLLHWKTRVPCGPCHYGIGGKFLEVEYPFLRYNLFFWVYVLSFFPRARQDTRFRQAVDLLATKLDDDGRMVVERPHRNLKGLAFCERGAPSDHATMRYREIERNLVS